MNKYLPKNILVTGAAGFIGSNFVHYILKTEPAVKIISLDKLTYAGNLKNLHNLPDPTRHVFIEGDICDRAIIDGILTKYHVDTIVHFAAETHVDRSIVDPTNFIQTNIVGTFVLLEAARNYWLDKKKLSVDRYRFHHVSTDEVYGELSPDSSPFVEENTYKPSSPYAASKAASNHLVQSYFRTYNLATTISNCSNNYGAKQHPEKLIPVVLRCCFEQKPIPIYGDGSHIRNWLYVDDHCRAIIAILHQGVVGETYNIGSNSAIDNLSLTKMLCALMDEKYPQGRPHNKLITLVKDRPGHDYRYTVDFSKITRNLQWSPLYSFQEGLAKIV